MTRQVTRDNAVPGPDPAVLANATSSSSVQSHVDPQVENGKTSSPNVYEGQERFEFLKQKAAGMSSRTKTKNGKKMEYSTVLWAVKQDNAKLCKPPLTSAELTQLVKSEWDQAQKDKTEKRKWMQEDQKLWGSADSVPGAVCDDPDPDFNYLVLPRPDEEDSEGLFPPGVNAVGGPSGAGKTTWTIQFFLAWVKGLKFFGRTVCPKKFQFITFDRRKGSLRRSLRRMRIAEETFPRKPVSPPAEMPLKKVIETLWKNDPMGKDVRVFVVEGIDMNIPKFGDPAETKKYLAELQAFCEQHTLWIIGTMGSPKSKPGEKYAAPRERLLGSTVWGRMIETIIVIEPRDPEDPNSIRELHLLPRDGKSEKYQFEFERGRLVEVQQKEKGDLTAEVRAWLQANLNPNDTFTLAKVASGLNAKKSSIQKAIETLQGMGWADKIKYGVYRYVGEN